jgi:hypothetical protein
MTIAAPTRRHSAPRDHVTPVRPSGKGRASSTITGFPLQQQTSRDTVLLTPVPEDGAPSPEELDPPSPKTQRWSRRFSWIPGWTFAGSPPLTPPSSVPSSPRLDGRRNTASSQYADSNGRLSRLRSSISTMSEVMLRDTAPSHETNFPDNIEFPPFEGRRMTLSVYGTLDHVDSSTSSSGSSSSSDDDAAGPRLQLPRGFAHADVAVPEAPAYAPMLAYVRPTLRDGDMLVRPFVERYARDPHVAMVVRGAVQDCVYKCMVVGVFPLKAFGDWKVLENYELDVMMYDPGMNLALGGQ